MKQTSLPPLEAKRPELVFFYYHGKTWKLAQGHGSDYFSSGDTKKFKLPLHKRMGKCQVVIADGNTHDNYDCTDRKDLVLNLGKYYLNHPRVIALAITSERLGTQLGYFYPEVSKPRQGLDLRYQCPSVFSIGNLYGCIRPKSFNLDVSLVAPGNGKLLYTYTCGSGDTREEITEVTENQVIRVEVKKAKTDYCLMAFAFKGDKKRAAYLHVRFYDNKYIPLASPYAKGDKVCVSYESQAYRSGDRQYKGSGCKDLEGLTISWDSIGRVSVYDPRR